MIADLTLAFLLVVYLAIGVGAGAATWDRGGSLGSSLLVVVAWPILFGWQIGDRG